jgi:hypothetical protein
MTRNQKMPELWPTERAELTSGHFTSNEFVSFGGVVAVPQKLLFR